MDLLQAKTGHWLEVARGLEDVEWFERVTLGKARKVPNVLLDDHFIREILGAANRLRKRVDVAVNQRDFKRRLREATGIDWHNVADRSRQAAVNEVVKLLQGLPSQFVPGVNVELDRTGRRVLQNVRDNLARENKRVKVDPTFAQENEVAVRAIRDSQAIFFQPEYERRARNFRNRAQATIADGLKQGLGRREIADRLAEQFHNVAVAPGYWETVAAVHVARARSFAAAVSYAEAGYTKYQVVAIIDERTTEICQALDGQVFSLEKAMDHFDAFEDATSLDEIKGAVAPFANHTEEGGNFVLSSGERLPADVTAEEAQGMGLHMPPFHYRCRSTVVPVD